MAYTTIRTETASGVRSIWLARPEAYNTITLALREELADAIDVANWDPDVHVILLRAEGPAFCAGYGLDWSTAAQASESTAEPRVPQEEVRGDVPAVEPPAPADGPEGRAVGTRSAMTGPGETGQSGTPSVGAGAGQAASSAPARDQRVWDSVGDLRMISLFVDTYMKLWYSSKPTIAAVNGWCIGGGTDMVLCADVIIAADDAVFGYPPSRVWGTPTTAMWVYRMGLEQAKRYLLTGDEISAEEAARIGLILESVPADDLQEHAFAFASRMAQVPTNQLVMLKLLCNQTVENMGMSSSRLVGSLFDGIARHTQEGLDFVARAGQVGFREAVRERDDPFGDYGSGPRSRRAQ